MTRPLKLMVLGCSALSTGELTIVLDWVRRLARPVDVRILVPATLAPQLSWAGTVVSYPTAGGARAVSAMQAAIDAAAPDLLVIADLLLFHAAPHETGAPLHAVLQHAMARCRVTALDLYDWDGRVSYLECYGRVRFADAPPIPAGVSRLMPSPYLPPARSSPGRARFAMMGDSVPLDASERELVRRELGVDGSLVLTLTSPWQHVAQGLPDAAGLTRRFPALMLRLLDEVAGRIGAVTLLHLGPAAINLPADVARLRYHHVAQMPPDRFRRILGAADLVLTPNCIASSVVRGASMRVPAAALRLGRAAGAAGAGGAATPAQSALASFLREAAPVYPFLVWPLGLHDAMLSILEDNPFAGIQAHFDVLEPDRAVDGLVRLLIDPAARDEIRHAQAAYFAVLAHDLDEADDALSHVC